MTIPGESLRPNPIQSLVEELLKDEYLLAEDARKIPYVLDINRVKLLQSDFPSTIDGLDLSQAVTKDRHQVRAGMLGRLIMKVEDKLYPARPTRPVVEVSPTFISRSRTLRGTPEGVAPWVHLTVSEESYDGWISVDDQVYNFTEAQPIIRATSSWMNPDGRAAAYGIGYIYVPHLGLISSTSPQEEAAETLQYINKNVKPIENMATIIEASYKIPR